MEGGEGGRESRVWREGWREIDGEGRMRGEGGGRRTKVRIERSRGKKEKTGRICTTVHLPSNIFFCRCPERVKTVA